MDLKKLTGKLTTIVAAGAMVMSIGGGVVWANNCTDTEVRMSFNEAEGEYLHYTSGRMKQDTSCGYIKGESSSNGYSFNASLVGSDRYSNYYEDFDLIDYDVFPSDEIWMYNYVKENGYKNGYVMWPLRTAVSGKQMTPAGATEIMEIIGKNETIRRVKAAIEKLENL